MSSRFRCNMFAVVFLFVLPTAGSAFQTFDPGVSPSFLSHEEQAASIPALQKQVLLESKILATDVSNGATFGVSVDISGDTAVVGAWQDQIGRNRKQGSVYVFVRRNGAWINQAKLTAADGKRNEYFGQRVAIDGDTIVVGVPQAVVNGRKDQGAVYVFTRTGDNWGRQLKLTASDGAASAIFGWSVGISGSTIIVGAPGVDVVTGDGIPQAHGAAYVFTKVNDDWQEKARITGDNNATAAFGYNVAIDGKTAVVNGGSETSYAHTIYIFSDSGTGWKKEHKILTPRDAEEKISGSGVSSNVAIDGSTVVIGGSHKGKDSDGAVYVYVRNASGWSRQAKLTPSDGQKGDNFGWSADISGDRIIVGSSMMSNETKGSAYVFVRRVTPNGAAWVEEQILTADDGFMFDLFGGAVAISGERMIVGADNHDPKRPNGNEGAAYIYSADPSASASLGDGRDDSNWLALVEGARTNGYRSWVENGRNYFQAENVTDPATGKPMEGMRTVSYGCEKPIDVRSEEVAWSRGRSARILIPCTSIFSPKVRLQN